MNDLRFALRQLLKHPASTAVILATLALVIGTMSLAFGVVQFEQSRRMPFPSGEQMIRFWQYGKQTPREDFPSAIYAQTAGKLKGMHAIAALGGYNPQVLTGVGAPKSLSIQYMTASAFDVAGFRPLLGRTFTTEEQRSGREDLLVIGFNAWQSEFQGSESVIDQVVSLNEKVCTIIGVMPDGFEHNALFYGLDGWLPRDFESPSHDMQWIRIVGRRSADVSSAQLNAEVEATMSPLVTALDSARGWEREEVTVRTLPLDKRPGSRDAAAIVSGASIAGFVIVIAAFNVANILLGRILTRRHEFAVRFALGAGRWRVIRQLLLESLLLSFMGAAVGVLGAVWVAGWALAQGVNAQFTPAVLGWTAGATAVMSIAIGWLPALRAARGDLLSDLSEAPGSAVSGGPKRHRLRNFLVVGQMAMATSLCIAAGLLVRSYLNQRGFDPGFDTSRLIVVSASLNQELYSEPEQRLAYLRQALEHLRALPGVEEVACGPERPVSRLPFPTGFRLEGQDAWGQVGMNIVSPNYFSMIDQPVTRGRGFSASDRRGSTGVVVVNQSFVQRYFPGDDPVGKRVGVPVEGDPDWLTIVGIVPDRRNLGQNEDLGPEVWLSAEQFCPTWVSASFLVRTRPLPATLRDSLRDAVQSVDRSVPTSVPSTVDSQIEHVTGRNIGGMRAVSGIGLFGLIMSVIGIYGVIAYSATERTREFGIRMALGATRGEALGLVLRQALRLILIGLVIGLMLGGLTTFGLREFLFGIQPLDPIAYGTVALVVFASALAAAVLPSRRVLRINPMEALRNE